MNATSSNPRKHSVLILGGTTESRELAHALAPRDRDLRVTLSLAGRTMAPAAQPVPVRSGGFGGVEGLAEYLRAEHIDFLIDATHPYADRMSMNAAQAAALTHVPILMLRRPPWIATSEDMWIDVDDVEHAVRALGQQPRRVFLGIGRQELVPFEVVPQHFYVVRSVDPVEPPLNVPNVHYILSRGPFTERDDRSIFESYSIDAVVAKNSGGAATYSKIAAARSMRIPVFMFKRPAAPACQSVATVGEAVEWLLRHTAGLGVPRGV